MALRLKQPTTIDVEEYFPAFLEMVKNLLDGMSLPHNSLGGPGEKKSPLSVSMDKESRIYPTLVGLCHASIVASMTARASITQAVVSLITQATSHSPCVISYDNMIYPVICY